MLKCHTEIMVGTAKNKKQAVTAVTPHFQLLYHCVFWSYPQFQFRSEGYIVELMSKYYYKGLFSPLRSPDFELLRYFRLPH